MPVTINDKINYLEVLCKKSYFRAEIDLNQLNFIRGQITLMKILFYFLAIVEEFKFICMFTSRYKYLVKLEFMLDNSLDLLIFYFKHNILKTNFNI